MSYLHDSTTTTVEFISLSTENYYRVVLQMQMQLTGSLQAGLWFKPIGLVQRLAATWRRAALTAWTRVNSRNTASAWWQNHKDWHYYITRRIQLTPTLYSSRNSENKLSDWHNSQKNHKNTTLLTFKSARRLSCRMQDKYNVQGSFYCTKFAIKFTISLRCTTTNWAPNL